MKLYAGGNVILGGMHGSRVDVDTPGSGGNVSDTGSMQGDPLLSPLDFHGGPTKNYLPGQDGSAINKGISAYCADPDQRGVSRPQNGQCDIGSVELRPGEVSDGIFANGFE